MTEDKKKKLEELLRRTVTLRSNVADCNKELESISSRTDKLFIKIEEELDGNN